VDATTISQLDFRFLNKQAIQNCQLHSVGFPKHLQANHSFKAKPLDWLSMRIAVNK